MFIAESMYSTIIHIRRVSFMQVCKRTFCLSGLASILFFLSIRLLINYGGLFYFSLLFWARSTSSLSFQGHWNWRS